MSEKIEKQTLNKHQITIALLKPDLVERGNLQEEAIEDITNAGFIIAQSKKFKATEDFIDRFYASVKHLSYFEEYKKSILDKEMIGLLLVKTDGNETLPAFQQWRNLIGKTKPEEQEAHTLRKKYALSITLNSFHGSDSYEAVELERKTLGFDI